MLVGQLFCSSSMLVHSAKYDLICCLSVLLGRVFRVMVLSNFIVWWIVWSLSLRL